MKLIVIATHMADDQHVLHDSYMHSGTYCTSAVPSASTVSAHIMSNTNTYLYRGDALLGVANNK